MHDLINLFKSKHKLTDFCVYVTDVTPIHTPLYFRLLGYKAYMVTFKDELHQVIAKENLTSYMWCVYKDIGNYLVIRPCTLKDFE